MLNLKQLTIKFNNQKHARDAVFIESLSINKGELLALLGESGSGKTLLSLAIIGLLPDNALLGKESKILFQGKDISEYPESAMKKIRGKKISMIFQEPMTSLNPVMTVGRQVAETLIAHKICPKIYVKKRVIELFNQVELKDPEELYDSYPHQLSGGMKQRIMIAMALACEPELLIADEPTSALDVTVQYEILKLLKKIQHENNLTILLITHDISVVKLIADRVAVMYAGYLMELGLKEKFFQKTLHPYSQGLFESMPSFAKRGMMLQSIEGVVPPLTQKVEGCIFYQRCPFRSDNCLIKQPKLISFQQSEVACILYDDTFPTTFILDFKEKKVSQFQAVSSSSPSKIASINEELVLELEDVKVYFPIRKGILKRVKGYVKAVDGVSFQINRGRTTAIVGESGCGKTTLAKSILGLIPHTAGLIKFPQVDFSQQQLFRKYAQIIFQDPFSSLNPRMLVGDIIAEGMRSLKIGSEETQTKTVEQLIRQMGLPEDSIMRYPHEFSGGQRQRICIARALAVEPQVIICDEPTSALDLSIQAQIINLLKALQVQHQLTYLFISHNMAVVAYFADEIIVMKKGQIIEKGTTEQVLNYPEQNYTKKLIRTANFY